MKPKTFLVLGLLAFSAGGLIALLSGCSQWPRTKSTKSVSTYSSIPYQLNVSGYQNASGYLVATGGAPQPTPPPLPQPTPPPGPQPTPPSPPVANCSSHTELISSSFYVGPGVWQTKTLKVEGGKRSNPCYKATTTSPASRVRIEMASKCTGNNTLLSVWPPSGSAFSNGTLMPTFANVPRSADYGDAGKPTNYVPPTRFNIAVDGLDPGTDCNNINSYDLIVKVDPH